MNSVRAALRAFNVDGHRGASLLVCLLLIVALAAAGEQGREALQYERSAIAAGQWWRLVTAHLVHLDAAHALVNAAGLVLVFGLVIGELEPRHWALVVAGAAATIDLGLWLLYPQIAWYVGASGILHGMLAAGSLLGSLRGDRVAWITLALLLLKLAYEAAAGPLALAQAQPVVTAAHWLGALGAGLCTLGLRAVGVRPSIER